MSNPLTTDDLVREYQAWGPHDRNKDDLRFGQYLLSRYSHVPDGFFFTESQESAYQGLLEALKHYQR